MVKFLKVAAFSFHFLILGTPAAIGRTPFLAFQIPWSMQVPTAKCPNTLAKHYGSVEFLFVYYLISVKKLPIGSLSLCVILGNAT